jgi:hypothetical protein
MQVPTKQVLVGNGASKFTIRQITDTHHGAPAFASKLFSLFSKTQEKDVNSMWIHTGDVGDPDRRSRREMEASISANRRSEVLTQSEKNRLWVESHIIPKYRKIASSCLGFLAGDHYMLIDGKPCTEYICKRLGVPYLGERSSFANIIFRCKSNNSALQYVIHARHGKGGGSTMGGDIGAMVKGDVGQIADLHCHPVRVEFITHKGSKKNKVIWYVRGGSFLDGPEYAKKAEYNPLPCGWAEVELNLSRSGTPGADAGVQQLHITTSKASIIAA